MFTPTKAPNTPVNTMPPAMWFGKVIWIGILARTLDAGGGSEEQENPLPQPLSKGEGRCGRRWRRERLDVLACAEAEDGSCEKCED
jgi:hypothetical protein